MLLPLGALGLGAVFSGMLWYESFFGHTDSVAKFYRAMGEGYQARINRLLRTWAQMKIAGEVQLDAHLAKRAGVREEKPAEEDGPKIDPEYLASIRRGKSRGER